MRWFGWLRRRDPLERGLFAYHDGRRKRLADPLDVEAAIRKHDGGDKWGDWLAVLNATAKVPTSGGLKKAAEAGRDEAVTELVKLARAVFGLDPVGDDGKGLSGGECLSVLARYLAFLVDLKDRYLPLPNLPARPALSPGEQDTGE